MGRNSKPTELHILEGTYEECYHGKRADIILQQGAEKIEITIPPEITNQKIRDNMFQTLKHISRVTGMVQIQDLPTIINAYVSLQEVEKINAKILKMSVVNPDYKHLIKLRNLLLTQYNQTMYKFGVTPIERAKLTLSVADIEKSKSSPLEELLNE